MSGENQIRLNSFYGTLEERAAAGAISPGHLIEVDSNGDVQVHSTAGGVAERMVALEDGNQGNDLDDAYAASDEVPCWLFLPGDRGQVFLQAGENVSKGDKLISAGDGTLQAAVGGESAAYHEHVVAVADEALDLSASGAVDTLLDVRFV